MTSSRVSNEFAGVDFSAPGEDYVEALIGQTVGNYRITAKIGHGGMGAVFLAEHPHIGKRVALKVLHHELTARPDYVTRFFNEARAVNDIGHPNIVDIIDFGVLNHEDPHRRLVYFTMEYLAGESLGELLAREAPLPPARALTIALQIADALSASHQCGIVHRDLKPANVMISKRGRDTDFVKLLDFGIAKLTHQDSSSGQTRTGVVIGTPAYMSPEQCEGKGRVDHRSDIYSLGIVLYEMLTGRVPFLGDGLGEVLVQHMTQKPTPPSTFRVIPPHVEAVVLKALEKSRDQRYPNMAEFMRAMTDPVAYVNAHGGVIGFAKRALRTTSTSVPPPVLKDPTLSGATHKSGSQRRWLLGSIFVVLAATAVAVGTHFGRTQEPAVTSTPLASAGAAVPQPDEPKPSADAAPPSVPDAAPAAVIAIDAAAPTPDAPAAPPPPAVPATTQLVFVTKPDGAKIYVNGVLVGTTPYTHIMPAGAGAVELEARLPGYGNKQVKHTLAYSDIGVKFDWVLEKSRKPKGKRRNDDTPEPPPQKPDKDGLLRPGDI